MLKTDKLKRRENISVTIMYKQFSNQEKNYLQSFKRSESNFGHIYKRPVKFQKEWNKIAVGVALTKYLIIVSESPKNDYVHKKGKR